MENNTVLSVRWTLARMADLVLAILGNPSGGMALVPVNNSGDTAFCCGFGYNMMSESCMNNPTTPFYVSKGRMINNRTSGSTSPNATSVGERIVTTVTVSTSASTSALAISSAPNIDIGVGLGVGIPLGVALVTTLILLWRERRQKENLKQEVIALSNCVPEQSGNSFARTTKNEYQQNQGKSSA